MTMLNTFWTAARTLAPGIAGERDRPGVREGDIGERMRRAGLTGVHEGALEARVDYTGFDDFWEPFTYGVGPAGHYLATLPAEQQARLRETCRAELPAGAFTLTGRAWYARGTVSS
jgi:hypothetical protein